MNFKKIADTSFRVNNRNVKESCEIWSKLTIKTTEYVMDRLSKET